MRVDPSAIWDWKDGKMAEYLMTGDARIVTGPQLWDEANGPRPESDRASFANALQAVRDGFATLNANIGDVGELAEADGGESGYTLAPEVLGQIIMIHLGIDPDDRLDLRAKQYWMQVGEHLGPDWLRALRRTVAFMDKVDQF